MARKKVSQHVQRLKAVAREHGTPVFVIRRSVLQAQVERFRKALPRVEPCYAVKANPHPEVVKVMAACGVGFDVASLAEMDVVLKAGVAPDRIIFANTIKPVDSLRIAAKRGVDLMTFDSEYELDKIA
ncbi:MAG: hypothetical protein JXB04_01140, partial [Kiritimatiellae bacterium]|nr:hypothetical protein [Kiritimatiellia bacterium]